jgi:hypothetical protein
VRIRTDVKRAWLIAHARAATAASQTLEAHLLAQIDSKVESIESGLAIAETSGNGHSTSFSKPGEASAGPEEMAGLVGEMLRRYQNARQQLIDAGTASPTDAEILAQMLAYLNPASSSGISFLNVRQPGGVFA